MKNLILILVLVAIFGLAGFLVLRALPPQDRQPLNESERAADDRQITLYYGDGCPHCAIVDSFLENNRIAEKITLAKKEVYHNQQNSLEMIEKGRTCGLVVAGERANLGVPFLWTGEKCLLGDQGIIDFFRQELNLPLE